ncbi:hypothetical protein PENSPDRAFT_759348 [Peniophora sp. CONT]|nr:hypothetical protein PENSPDRAFT_759348 [Peniophora sp. CONT]
MSTRTASSFWSTRFEDRLEELPEDFDALSAELADAKCAYEGFVVALQARLETLRLNVQQASAMTTTVLSLPAEIYLNICAVLAEIDPLGEVIEYDDCASSIEEHRADDTSDLYEADDVSYVDSETSDIRLSPGLGWVRRVTHVCALWRRRAIENATLWTTIPLNLCMPWLRELIKRSNNLPLDIIVPCDADPDIACCVLEDSIHRARSITVEGHTITGIVESILDRARLLERLDVNNDYGEYWTIPGNLLLDLPRLKTISITSAAEIPKLAAASQITHLAILSASSAPSRESLRDMLQSLINVQYLQLEDCLAPACFEGFFSEPISLSVLETLILRGPTGSCGDVIRSISPPSSASLALYLLPDPLWPDAVNRQYDEDGEPVYDVSQYMRCSGLDRLYNRLGDSTYHALRISCTTPDYWTRTSSRKVYWQLVVTAHRDAGQLDEYDPDNLQQYGQWSGPSFADVKVVCTLPPIPQHDGSVYVYNTAFPMGVFERTIEALPLASLTVLSLNIDALALAAERSYSGSWNQMAWFSILAGLDRLKCLQLISSFNKVNENWPTSSYVGLLSALSIADDEGVHRPIPHLETLHLLDVFANASGQVEGEDNHSIHMSAAQALRQFVKSRRWKAEIIHVEYTSAAWQYRYFNPLGGPLKSAKPVRLGLSHDWQLEGLDASVSD